VSGEPRVPAVAGTFYPAEPARLRAMVDELMAAAKKTPRPANLAPAEILGLLVPHAGLVYSGAVAALSWALAGEMAPATIVLAGTDHEAWARGVGVWTGGPWRTPFGEVPIDADLASRIVELSPFFAADDEAHLTEHSLEVQLPLLSVACPAARIVPLAVSPRLRAHAQAGVLLGRLLAKRRAAGERILRRPGYASGPTRRCSNRSCDSMKTPSTAWTPGCAERTCRGWFAGSAASTRFEWHWRHWRSWVRCAASSWVPPPQRTRAAILAGRWATRPPPSSDHWRAGRHE